MTLTQFKEWASRKDWEHREVPGPMITSPPKHQFRKLCKYADGSQEKVRIEINGGNVSRAVRKDEGWSETHSASLLELELSDRDKLRWPTDESADSTPKPAKSQRIVEERVERVSVYDMAWTRTYSTRANSEEPKFGWYDRRTGSKTHGLQTTPLPKPPK